MSRGIFSSWPNKRTGISIFLQQYLNIFPLKMSNDDLHLSVLLPPCFALSVVEERERDIIKQGKTKSNETAKRAKEKV
jgi:hypothetical protein